MDTNDTPISCRLSGSFILLANSNADDPVAIIFTCFILSVISFIHKADIFYTLCLINNYCFVFSYQRSQKSGCLAFLRKASYICFITIPPEQQVALIEAFNI
jgi:hypothetical protein